MRTLPHAVLLVLALLLLHPSLRAQEDALFEELSLFAVTGQSGNPELSSPVGFGFRSTWNFSRNWLFRISVQQVKDASRKMGTICKSYAPHIDCVQDMTHSRMTLTGVRSSLLRTIILGSRVRLGFGGGLSFNGIRARNMGEDGRRADLLAPKTGQVGYLALISADLILHPRLPFRLTGGLTSHWVHFHTCSGSTPPQYDPFCKISNFREAELGLALPF